MRGWTAIAYALIGVTVLVVYLWILDGEATPCLP
jgi:hypothetical protein